MKTTTELLAVESSERPATNDTAERLDEALRRIDALERNVARITRQLSRSEVD